MMATPYYYISQFVDATYQELMAERDRLIYDIRKYEEMEKKGDRSGDGWLMDPSPDVIYQCNLEYLSQLSLLMNEKYNHEYVWGDKSLASDRGDDPGKPRLKKKITIEFDPINPDEIRGRAEESRQEIKSLLNEKDSTEEI